MRDKKGGKNLMIALYNVLVNSIFVENESSRCQWNDESGSLCCIANKPPPCHKIEFSEHLDNTSSIILRRIFIISARCKIW